MPIRLNLLAEAQALEELRRKDPVKRVVLIGLLTVVAALVWSTSLQLRLFVAKSELNRIEGQIQSITNAYSQVVANQARTADAAHKLASLRQLATNRFLQAPVLNALQQTVVEDVRLTKLKVDQAYTIVEPPKPVKDSKTKTVKASKPASSTERIAINLEARDTAPTPGDQVTKYKVAVSTHPFFQSLLGRTNDVRLASLSPPQAGDGAKVFVPFVLECRLPEKTR